MEKIKKLETPLSFQVFEFLKNYLYNFTSGKEIKPTTTNQKALKASFYYVI